jgi:hypothetical protein
MSDVQVESLNIESSLSGGAPAWNNATGSSGYAVQATVINQEVVHFPRESDDDYSDDQFGADLKRASKPLNILAEKARKSLKNDSALKFPT